MSRNTYIGLNIAVVLGLILLPFYIFGWNTPLGGDDTKLLYSYPQTYLKNVTFFSWFNVSTIGINASNQYTFPFLAIWSLIAAVVKSNVILAHMAFSIPMVVGFIFFQKFTAELFKIKTQHTILLVGALFFVLSPITIVNQYFIFLTPVWLIGLAPLIGFLYLRYLATSKFIYIYSAILSCFFFSISLIAIPWILGILLPLFAGGVVLAFFYTKKEITSFVKKTLIFFGFIALSQSYWLLGFFIPYFLRDSNSFVSKYGSKEFVDTFIPTVTSTATGSIIYPLLGLFHRQIAFDFVWQLKYTFQNFYDKTFLLNSIYIVVIAVGIFLFRKHFDKSTRQKYIFILVSFVVSLYLFTVNIGILLDLFLFFGKIPGFLMFRNFYDKFALGYIFIYAILLTISLYAYKKRFPKTSSLITVAVTLIILINCIPIKQIVNAPIWSTKNTYRALNIPTEYKDFMKEIEKNISSTNTILSVPVGSSLYTAIKDENSNNAYLGVSPVKIFSGVNDISGYLSFNFTDEGLMLDKTIINKEHDKLNAMLYKWNINYVLLTKNLTSDVLKSYGFNQQSIKSQDKDFLEAITDKKILTSRNGNYELYTTVKKNTLFDGSNIVFQKISPVKYRLYIRDIKDGDVINFKDSYYSDWKLYLEKNPTNDFCKEIVFVGNKTTECKSEFKYLEGEDLKLLWKKEFGKESHTPANNVHNKWIININELNDYDNTYIKKRNDGTKDIELTLYFYPQLYFYYGFVISLTLLTLSTIYVIYQKIKK